MKQSSTRPVKKQKQNHSVLQTLESRQLLSVTLPTASPAISAAPLATGSTVVGYTPAQVRTAYGESSLSYSPGKTAANGAGQTIAIVDAYNDPTIASDLSKFDTEFGLAAASLAVVNEAGGTSLPQSNVGWAEEISLDVEWAHAIAPGAKILLVEADSSSESDLLAGVNYARSASGVSVVSMSWGGSEFSGETGYDSYFTTPSGHTGVTFVAASGDTGSSQGVDWPASSPDVLSVGGTSLTISSSGTYRSETGWADSGGGVSRFEGEPSYQSTVQSTGTRSVPDVSLDANPTTGVAVYDSYGTSSAWMEFGGTSAAAPQWGAIVAIADQGRVIAGQTTLDGATNLLPTIYSIASSYGTYSFDFHDVTSGSTSYSVVASGGYDQVTGLGTPKADSLVAALVASTKKVTLTKTAFPTTTGTRQPPPPPWWMAINAPALPTSVVTSPATTATTSAASAVASVDAITVQTTTTTATVNTGPIASPAANDPTNPMRLSDAVAATASTSDHGLGTGPTCSIGHSLAAIASPLGLVGANILSTTEAAGSVTFAGATSFAQTLAASGWPAGTTELRMAAESFARQLAENATPAAKPMAIALAAAGILYAVAGQAKKSKGKSPLFGDRTIVVA